jgi:hypothetical protein
LTLARTTRVLADAGDRLLGVEPHLPVLIDVCVVARRSPVFKLEVKRST